MNRWKIFSIALIVILLISLVFFIKITNGWKTEYLDLLNELESRNSSLAESESDLGKCITKLNDISEEFEVAKSDLSNQKKRFEGISNFIITWDKAKNFIYQEKIVCGRVVNHNSRSNPNFLDLGFSYPFPNRVSVVIWPADLDTFDRLLLSISNFSGKDVCVIGHIYSYKGIPQIEVENMNQISIQ